MALPSVAGSADASGETPAALVVFPVDRQDPTREQCDAVARVLGITAYEARYKFVEPLPRVARVGGADELLPLVDELRAAGVEAAAFEQEAILPPLRPFRVQQGRFDGRALHLSGPRGEVRVDLLVAGRFDFKVSGHASVGLQTVRAESRDTVMFAHLYAGGWGDPLELSEADILDWDFLGGEKGPVRRVNFQRLLDRIRAQPGVTWNESLREHATRIKDCTIGVSSSMGAGDGSSHHVSKRTNMAGADVLSRVIYHMWRAERGLDATALETSLTVVSEQAPPEARVAAAFGGAPPPAGAWSAMGGAAPTGRPSGRQPPVADPGPTGDDAKFRPPADHLAKIPARRPSQRLSPPVLKDGLVHCRVCDAPRSVNDFGRCNVCLQIVAKSQAGRPKGALVWQLKQYVPGACTLLICAFALLCVPKLFAFGIIASTVTMWARWRFS